MLVFSLSYQRDAISVVITSRPVESYDLTVPQILIDVNLCYKSKNKKNDEKHLPQILCRGKSSL